MNSRNCFGSTMPQVQAPQYTTNLTTQGYQPIGASPGNGAVPITALPTGVPTGPAYNGITAATNGITSAPLMPGTVSSSQAPQTVQSPFYLAGYLRRNIGQRMRVEFLIGTSGPMVDRIGTLVDVGASYIVLEPVDSDDLIVADLYSIKFVTIYR